MRTTITIAFLLAAASAAGAASGTVGASRVPTAGLRPCPDISPNAGAAARKFELRCLINDARRQRALPKLAASRLLQLAADRLLSVRCRRTDAGCGAAFDQTVRRAILAHGYNGKIRYVYYDVSNNPSALMAYIRRTQSWLGSGTYRDLGIAYRPGGSARRDVWVVIVGYRF